MTADIAFDRNPCAVTSHLSDGRAWSLRDGHMLTFVGKASRKAHNCNCQR